MLELYHWEPNLHFLKPLIALAEKQVDFTARYFNPLEFEQFAPGFPANLESSLQLEREGPVLVHDGTVITSSFFMLEYIAEALPGVDLYPGEAYEHYRARAWGQFLTLSLGAGVSALGCAKYLTPVLARREQNGFRIPLVIYLHFDAVRLGIELIIDVVFIGMQDGDNERRIGCHGLRPPAE